MLIILRKILLISDTHGYIDDKIIDYSKKADEIWHAGDIGNLKVTDSINKLKPLRAVYGNIDGKDARSQFPLDNKFRVEDTTVWMTHIGGYPNKYHPRVREGLKEIKPKIFISGHSHILKIQYDKKLNLLHLNPGAAGKYGFHTIRTMLRFELNKGEIEKLEIIELAKKS